MKMLSVLLMVFLVAGAAATPVYASSTVSQDGYYNGIKLCGKVKIVESFPDIKVQVVEHFPDLKVQVVEYFPDNIGKWQFVESFPDFTIQFVTSFPDIKIKFVNGFPGVSN